MRCRYSNTPKSIQPPTKLKFLPNTEMLFQNLFSKHRFTALHTCCQLWALAYATWSAYLQGLSLLTSPWCRDLFPTLRHPILPWALFPSRMRHLLRRNSSARFSTRFQRLVALHNATEESLSKTRSGLFILSWCVRNESRPLLTIPSILFTSTNGKPASRFFSPVDWYPTHAKTKTK